MQKELERESSIPAIPVQSSELQAETLLEHLYLGVKASPLRESSTILWQTPVTTETYQTLRTRSLTFLEAHHSVVLTVDCRQPAVISFWPLQALLTQILPTVVQEAPHLVEMYAAELQAIHPQLVQSLGIHPTLSLAQIALTPSERRSHRESEQLFRIINGFCDLLIQAQQACPSLNKAPLVIWWENLHLADRPTLLAFRRLNHWVHQSGAALFLVATLCPAALPTDSLTDDDPARYFNWRILHHHLLEEVRQQLFATEIILSDEPGPSITFTPLPDYLDKASTNGDGTTGKTTNGRLTTTLNEAHATLLALHYLQKKDVAKGTAYGLQAMRLAVFNLNLEGILFLGQQILPVLALDNFDTQAFQKTFAAITADDHFVAIEFSISSDIEQINDILVAIWKAAALVHTFNSQHQQAVDCYLQALSFATTPTMQAQLYMYLGLMAGKRLYRIEESRAYLRQGLALVESLDGEENALEQSWLLNVSALMAFQSKEYRDAMAMVQKGLANIKNYHQSETTHLKVNLISNISVLLEATKQLDQALKTWHFFRNFLGAANEIFTKHYFFREGGLLLKAGELAEASQCYQQSYEQAQVVHDKFHMKIIASACGHLSYQQGEVAEAQQWYAQSCQLGEEIGDYVTLPESLAAQAICCHKLGQTETAAALLQQAADIQHRCGTEHLEGLETLRQSLPDADPDVIAAWAAKVIKPMGTKLNRPFYLINLY